jgi:uncharacterized RDD family membrane protein YckC
MNQEEYPSILKRYLSTVIDSMFVLSMMVLAGYLFQNDNQMAINARVGMILFLFFVYEPVCTSKYCTLGQKVTGIRVRSMLLRENISITKAYLRIIIKILLGFLSFFTIPFTKNKRAIHDLVANSIVIEKNGL